MNRRVLGWLSFGAVMVGVGSYLIYQEFSTVQAQSPRIGVTINLVNRLVHPTGGPMMQGTQIFAQRTDGSYAHEVRNPLPEPLGKGGVAMAETRTVVDITSARKVVVSPAIRSLTTYPLKSAQLEVLRLPPASSCASSTRAHAESTGSAETSTIVGFRVIQFSEDIPPPKIGGDGRTSRRVTWLAPDLNCAMLRQVTTVTMGDGSFGGKHETEAVSVLLGDPDPRLFQVPPDYVEKPPSQAMSDFAALIEKPCPTCTGSFGSAADEAYFRRKAGK